MPTPRSTKPRPAAGPTRTSRIYSGIAALAGVGLLVFELLRLNESGGEGWLWILVGAFMVILGLIGVLQRSPPANVEDKKP